MINLHLCFFFRSITTIRIACNVCSHFKIDILLLENSKDTKCWRNNVITRGSSRKYERGKGLAKGVWKCTRGRGSEGLSVSALFEKFLMIEIVVFPLLIVRVILSEVIIWDIENTSARPAYAIKSNQFIQLWRHWFYAVKCFNRCKCIGYSKLKNKKRYMFCFSLVCEGGYKVLLYPTTGI